jgi:hypothetical protein
MLSTALEALGLERHCKYELEYSIGQTLLQVLERSLSQPLLAFRGEPVTALTVLNPGFLFALYILPLSISTLTNTRN